MTIDLHCHTTASDGSLEPRELIERAVEQGVKILSITDHDTISAYRQLQPHADLPVQLIPGIELSTVWQGISIHVLALNIRLDSEAILTAVAEQSRTRAERAELIGARLAKLGISDAYEGARKLAGKGWIGRPHFARYLVDSGVVPDERRAFKKFLGSGKPGDVKQLWPPLEKIIEWTRDSNGTAILAHPCRYRLTRSKLNRMLDGFAAAGGQGLEVVSGRQKEDEIKLLAGFCRSKDLLASCGSDFHRPGRPWSELGQIPPIPAGCKPVWEHW